MEELQETIAEKKKKNRQKLGGEAVAGVRAVFYMENKKTLTGCISLPVEESLNSEEIVKNYQKQLSNIKLGKDSTLVHHAFIACFGNLCVDMQKCVGFEVIFFQKDYAGVLKPNMYQTQQKKKIRRQRFPLLKAGKAVLYPSRMGKLGIPPRGKRS